jgi:hypothetical protein
VHRQGPSCRKLITQRSATYSPYVLEGKIEIFTPVLEEKHRKLAYVLEKHIIFVVEFQRVQYDTT